MCHNDNMGRLEFCQVVPKGQREPAPTSAPFWMDGALMGFRFSSPPVPVLTSLVNTG